MAGESVRPFRFGVGPSGLGPRPVAQWRDLAKEVEDLGFDTLCFGDHFDGRPAPGPIVVAVAGWTTSLRVGVHVYCNDFRHPVLLGQELVTIASLTDGRFEAGLGAGWLPSDYERAAIPMDAASVRIGRLRETVRTVKTMLADGDGSGGPTPPILIGGGGPKIISLAAEQADIVGLNVRLDGGAAGPSATREATQAKVDLIRGQAGDRWDAIELQTFVHHVDIRTAGADEDRVAAAMRMEPGEVVGSPHALVGSPSQMIEKLERQRAAYGISYVCVSADVMRQVAPIAAILAGR